MNNQQGIPMDYFNSRLLDFNKKLTALKVKINYFSTFRILVFLLTVTGVYLASSQGWMLVISAAVIGFGTFIYLVIKQSGLIKYNERLEALIEINETELALQARNWNIENDGKNYLSTDHPYATDLDMFGKKSLFQLINRSATLSGEKRLAHILNHPFKTIKELKKRQKAINELALKPEWRQEFQAIGKLGKEEDSDIENLAKWSNENKSGFNRPLYYLLLVLNPTLGFAVIFMIAYFGLNFSAFILFLLLPFSILVPKLGEIGYQHGQLSRKNETLKKYAALFHLLETENFNSEILVSDKNLLAGDANSASQAVNHLSEISAKFDYRLNLLVGILLNIFFLWDIWQIIRLEKWKTRNGTFVEKWFESLAEVDELASLAGFAFAHTESIYPVCSDNEFELLGENVKHPFLKSGQCVGNNINIEGLGQFRIITGANMAGKSTYLRTVGINLVLAMTGSPVLADKFIFTPVDLFTGIKTTDSLQDGESYFFAELKRLKEIIQHLEKGGTLFVILDEILRGTNSADKQNGSKSLIKQLLTMKASGLIATHDLALGELADIFPNNVGNQRFEVEIENNELRFDYQLKEGISQNLNATFLMKKMGITI